MKTCQKCGSQNEDDAAFCKNCGEPLFDASQEETKETEKAMQAPPKKPKSEKLSPKYRNMIIIVIVAAAVAAMTFIGVFACRNKQHQKQQLMGMTNSNALFSLQNGSDGSRQEGGSVVVRGNDVYYLYKNRLCKEKANGKTATVYQADSDVTLNHLNDYRGWFYFAETASADGNGNAQTDVYKMRADGKDLTKLFTQKHTASCEMIVYDGHIYWSHYGRMDSALYAYDLNGKNKKVIVEDEQGGDGDDFPIYKFAIDQHQLYIPEVGEGETVDLTNNTKKKFKLDVQGGLEDEHLLPFAEAGGKLYGSEADTSDPSSPTEQIYQYDLQSKKLKTVIDSLGSDEVIAVFADQKQCYILTEDASGDSYTLLDKDQNTVASFKDLYRMALTEKGFYVVDTDGKVHFYQKTAKAKTSTKTAKSTTENTSLSNLQIGVLTSLYHWPDYFKEHVSGDNGIIWGSETLDGQSYYYVTGNGDGTSTLYYRLDGDKVTYVYYSVSGDETSADADKITKTISLKSLISMYYKNDSQKAEVNGYVSKIESNTQKYKQESEQNTQQNNNSNNSNSSYNSSSSDDDYYSDDDSSSTNTDSDYRDDSSEDYE
jgi:hypothetical protein